MDNQRRAIDRHGYLELLALCREMLQASREAQEQALVNQKEAQAARAWAAELRAAGARRRRGPRLPPDTAP